MGNTRALQGAAGLEDAEWLAPCALVDTGALNELPMRIRTVLNNAESKHNHLTLVIAGWDGFRSHPHVWLQLFLFKPEALNITIKFIKILNGESAQSLGILMNMEDLGDGIETCTNELQFLILGLMILSLYGLNESLWCVVNTRFVILNGC